MTTEYQARLKSTGRNDVCPCGSERKYKKCHLAEDQKAQQAAHAVEVAKLAAAALVAAENEEEGAAGTDGPTKSRSGGGRKQDRTRQGGTAAGKQGARANNMPRRSAI